MNVKIYYDLKTGYLCDRFPKDIPHTEDSPFIEVSKEKADETMACEYGKFWAVRYGKLEIVDDDEVINTEEFKNYQKRIEISKYQRYLSDTDYVVAKLQESMVEDTDEDYQKMRNKYSEILEKRKQARKRINELES